MNTSPTSQSRQFYRQEDVQEILQLAIAREYDSAELTREQLVEIADELGISAENLALSEQEWLANQGEWRERESFNLLRQQRLQRNVTRYLIVNGFLVAINIIATGGISWSLYVALGWGLFLALNARKLLQTRGDDYESAFQLWRRKRRLQRSMTGLFDRFLPSSASRV